MTQTRREYMRRKRAIQRRKRERIRMLIMLAGIMVLFLSAVIVAMAAGKKEEEEPQVEVVFETMQQNGKGATAEVFEQDLSIPSMDWGAEDSYLLAKIAMAEAEGENAEGKAMVILVVLNRVWSSDFPNSIEGVIFQENQFTPVQNGRFDRVEPNEDCYKALDLIMVQKWNESEGALYFEATYNGDNTWHSQNLEYIKTVGNHNFYK